MYEYARESRKLRCLLALMDPKRHREQWETSLSLPSSFRGLDQAEAEAVLGGWLYCLSDLAGYLNANVSFADLFRTKRHELEKAFGGLDRQIRTKDGEPLPLLWNVQHAHRNFLRVPPIMFGSESERRLATVGQSVTKSERVILDKGAEIVTIKIRWGQFTDKEIGEAMRDFADKWRPNDAACVEPDRRKEAIRRTQLLSWLDALSAMRLASHYPKSSPSKSLRDLGGCHENAIECFSRVRLSRVASANRKSPQDVSETHFSTQTAQARSVFAETFLFLRSFPQSRQPENAATWSQRKRSTKIEISDPR
jgi:hypothetical protein